MERTPSEAAVDLPPPRTSIISVEDGGGGRRGSRLSCTGSWSSQNSSARSSNDGHVGNTQRVESVTLRVLPKWKRVSLACVNRAGYAALLGTGMSKWDYEKDEWMAKDISQFVVAVNAEGGVVDVLSGDRRFASFNAVKACDSHAAQAVRVVQQWSAEEEEEEGGFASLRLSGVVVTGQGLCAGGSLKRKRKRTPSFLASLAVETWDARGFFATWYRGRRRARSMFSNEWRLFGDPLPC